jgi:hypothetical protein
MPLKKRSDRATRAIRVEPHGKYLNISGTFAIARRRLHRLPPPILGGDDHIIS